MHYKENACRSPLICFYKSGNY